MEEESVLRCALQEAKAPKNKLRKNLFSVFDAMLLKLHGTRIKLMMRSFEFHMKICILTC